MHKDAISLYCYSDVTVGFCKEITHQTEANAWLSVFFYSYRVDFQSDKIQCKVDCGKVLGEEEKARQPLESAHSEG